MWRDRDGLAAQELPFGVEDPVGAGALLSQYILPGIALTAEVVFGTAQDCSGDEQSSTEQEWRRAHRYLRKISVVRARRGSDLTRSLDLTRFEYRSRDSECGDAVRSRDQRSLFTGKALDHMFGLFDEHIL